jgi:DNA-binding transcriptional ArsR family regulator
MLVPVRLSKLQHVSGSLQIREIPGLISRVDHRQHDVDGRFRRKARHRGRPDVFDLHRSSAQCRPNALLFVGVLRRPFRARVYEPDRPIGAYGRLQEVRLRSVRHGDLSKQLLDQLLDPLADLVTDCPDDIVGLSQPTVSDHLKILVDAGVLQRQQRGKWAYYRLVPETLAAISDQLTPPRAA